MPRREVTPKDGPRLIERLQTILRPEDGYEVAWTTEPPRVIIYSPPPDRTRSVMRYSEIRGFLKVAKKTG